MRLDVTTATLIAVSALLIVAAPLVPSWLVDQLLSGLALGLAVLGVMLLWRMGLISFGHGLYFGVGAYSTAFLYKYFGLTSFFVSLVTGIMAATLLGFVLGFLVRRYRGIFFAMLNLGLSMILYAILVKSSAFGSTDGFSVPPPSFFGKTFATDETRIALLFLLVLFSLGAGLALHRFLRSTLGQLTAAIRDNELRVDYLGFPGPVAVHIMYVISAALAGAGGTFMATVVGQVDPDSMVNWYLSGELVFVAVFSGAGSVIAPLVGSILFVLARGYALEIAPDGWQMIMGGVLLGTIMLLPGGVWSLLSRFPRSVGR
jgi:branched-chain amino acid transport system permease protein